MRWRVSASYVTRPIGCLGQNVITKCVKSREVFVATHRAFDPVACHPIYLQKTKCFIFISCVFFFHHYTCSLVFLDLWYSSILISPNGLSWLRILFIPRFRKFLFELPEMIELLRVNFATNIYLECMCVVGILYM